MYHSKTMNSPLGTLYLIANEEALISLDTISSNLYKQAIESKTDKILNLASIQLTEYFQGKRTHFDLPLEPEGTPFQQIAWKALMQIPYAQIWSYGEQAKFIKKPKASRAIGGANGKNPIPIIIPCHRVIGSTGKLTGYSGGMEMKIWLLEHEGHLLSVDKKFLLM